MKWQLITEVTAIGEYHRLRPLREICLSRLDFSLLKRMSESTESSWCHHLMVLSISFWLKNSTITRQGTFKMLFCLSGLAIDRLLLVMEAELKVKTDLQRQLWLVRLMLKPIWMPKRSRSKTPNNLVPTDNCSREWMKKIIKGHPLDSKISLSQPTLKPFNTCNHQPHTGRFLEWQTALLNSQRRKDSTRTSTSPSTKSRVKWTAKARWETETLSGHLLSEALLIKVENL